MATSLPGRTLDSYEPPKLVLVSEQTKSLCNYGCKVQSTQNLHYLVSHDLKRSFQQF